MFAVGTCGRDRNACAVRVCNRKLYNIIVDEPFNYRPVLDYDMYNNISNELQQTDTDGQDENNINRRHTYYIFCIIYTGVNNILVYMSRN